MYELTCPSCQTTRPLMFIRTGARCVCPQCSHPFIIKAEHYVRSVQTAAIPTKDPLASVGTSTPLPPTLNQGSTTKSSAGQNPAVKPSQTLPKAPSKPASKAKTPPPRSSAFQQAAGAIPVAEAVVSADVPVAVPVAAAAAPESPAMRLMAINVRRRHRKYLKWVVLGLVLVLFVIIATTFIDSNEKPLPAEAAVEVTETKKVQVVAIPSYELPLYQVGPPAWQRTDDLMGTPSHAGPIGFIDYRLTPQNDQGDMLIAGTVVCRTFEFFEAPRLLLMLLDGTSSVYARADISLPPMSGRKDNSQQSIRIVIPKELYARLSTVEWEIVPGKPLNKGTILAPSQITSSGSGRQTQLQMTYKNPYDEPVYKLTMLIQAINPKDESLVHWLGQWQGILQPGQSLTLQSTAPLEDPAWVVKKWQVDSVADLAQTRSGTQPD